MTPFNRNVITDADVERLATATSAEELPATFETRPPAGAVIVAGGPAPAPAPGPAPAPAPGGAGAVVVPTSDDFLTKLVKYVPLEILGVYLFVEGSVEGNVTDPGALSAWLGALLVGTLVLTVPYVIRVLAVVRPSQIAMSVLGLAVYVFAVGGWFATTSWYEPWQSSIVLPVFVLLVAIIRLKPLPPAGA